MNHKLFDRKLLRQNRVRAARNFSKHNFLYEEIANRITDNLEFFAREFDSKLEITHDSSLVRSKWEVMLDDEFLPFKVNSFDLITSNLNFHHINLIPQFLLQVRDLLKPGGVFIASFFGEENLSELRNVLFETESEIYGGISPRIIPTIDVKTAAHLLQKAGFTNPVANLEKIAVSYKNPFKLLQDLKMMGQGNVLAARSRKFFTKKFLAKILENYQKNYADAQGNVRATFEVITITGWKK